MGNPNRIDLSALGRALRKLLDASQRDGDRIGVEAKEDESPRDYKEEWTKAGYGDGKLDR